jgi:D-alanyl-D-alanine carboxypeptidase/D-alanyl-D-alanine-endopeptidase (penicillin-binding protein 4)
VYGNFIRWVQEKQPPREPGASPSISVYSIPEVNWKVKFSADTSSRLFHVHRKMNENMFEVTQGFEAHRVQDVPFITHGLESAVELLKDTVGAHIYCLDKDHSALVLSAVKKRGLSWSLLHSQPVDSLFQPLMYHSDNFFAEQTLLMVSNQKLGIMNDELIIDTLLKTDLKNLPQKPNWSDGSGLSRYNLFSPLDFIWLLDTMQSEFGLERMKRLLPTGGTGTLRNYYKQDSGYIFAKTGSLSDVLAISGYLISKKNHLIVFSVLVNNHLGAAYLVRRAVETFLHKVRSQY